MMVVIRPIFEKGWYRKNEKCIKTEKLLQI